MRTGKVGNTSQGIASATVTLKPSRVFKLTKIAARRIASAVPTWVLPESSTSSQSEPAKARRRSLAAMS